MKRTFGIIFSGVLLLLGALFQLLLAFGMAFAGVFIHTQIHSGKLPGASTPASPPMPGWMPLFIYALCAVFVALAVWGILTAIGLFRLRRWARYSVLVIGGILALFSLVYMLLMLVLMMVPLPGAAGMDASQVHSAQTMERVVLGVIALLHAILCAIGVFWLVYFNKKRVRDIFAGLPGQAPESPRPFLISVLAVLILIGAVSCLLFLFMPLPGVFFGLILHGWWKAAFYLVHAALLTAAGIGLWRLLEWGRLLTMALQVIGVVQYVVFLVHPSLYQRYTAEVNRIINPMQPQPQLPFQSLLHTVSFGIGILFLIAMIAVLHYYRGAFARPAEPPQIESAAP
jgi:uncharacterized membrane protein (DUF2068 family)